MPAPEVFALARDFGRAGVKAAVALNAVYSAHATAFEERWRANAAATSGRSGHRYPESITSTVKLGMNVEFEVGPESGIGQGGLGRGFEFGSVNQPPHLDGARAMPQIEKSLNVQSSRAMDGTLP